MKEKVFPFILGLALGTTGAIFLRETSKENNEPDDLVTLGVKCPVLDCYGNQVSILYDNTRYDLFLSDVDTSLGLEADVKVALSGGKVYQFISVNSIPVIKYWNKNKIQVEKVVSVQPYDVSDTGLSFNYNERKYNILLDIVNEGGIPLTFGSTVNVLIADGEDVFDILRVENIRVLDWEETDEEC